MLVVVTTLAPLAAVRSVRAQAASPGDTLAAPRDTVYPLPALTVRALGPTLPAARVPFAVSATDRTGEAATDPDLSLAQTLRAVPGVQIQNRYNISLGDRIAIRGFGARAQFGVRGVAVELDGLPLTLPDGQTEMSVVDPAFLDRVEAVRGPASAIYGNAAGGALLLETTPPPVRGAGEEIRLVGGGHGLRRVDGSVGAGWRGGGLRVDLSHLGYTGFRQHQSAGVWRAHGLVRLRPGLGRLSLSTDAVSYHADSPGGLPDSLFSRDPSASYPLYSRDHAGERARQAQLGARWRLPVPHARLELAAWGRRRSVDNPIPFRIIALQRALGGARATLRAGHGGLLWIAGAETSVQLDRRRNFVNQGGQRGDTTLNQHERVRAAAIYARLSAQLGAVGLMGGVRYDNDAFRVRDHLITAANPDDSGRRRMHALSPMAGVRITPLPGLNLYANVATAFETPTTSELANRPTGAGGFNPSLQPEHTVSYEAGVKGRVGGSVHYAVAVYRARVTHALVPYQVPGAPDRQFFRNAGSTVHRGVEASLSLGAGPGWSASASYTYADVRFQSDTLRGSALDGLRVPGVAPQRADLTLRYRPNIGGFLALHAGYNAAVPVNDLNTASAPAYTLADVRLALPGLGAGTGRVAPFVAVDNIFDRRYVSAVVVDATGGRYYEPGPGRTVYAGVSLSFGAR